MSAQTMHEGFRRRLWATRPFPSTVLPPRRSKRPRHAPRLPEVRGTLGYRVTNVVLWVVFAAVLPPLAALLGGPLLYELGVNL